MSSYISTEIVQPDPSRVIEGLRDTGYTFNTAVADVVDNSIAADAKHVEIQVGLDPLGEPYFFVVDDGTGMTPDGLRDAMRYGSPPRPVGQSLGKFGMGLKTASTSFCRQLTLVSRGAHAVRMLLPVAGTSTMSRKPVNGISNRSSRLRRPLITCAMLPGMEPGRSCPGRRSIVSSRTTRIQLVVMQEGQ